MNSSKKLFIFVLAACILAAWTTASRAEGMAVTGKIGTLGVGVDFTKSLTESFDARVGINLFSYTYTGEDSEIEYDFELGLFTAAVLADWHPGRSPFRFSAGLVLNNNKIDSTAKTKDTIEIGDKEYTPAQIGVLSGEITFNTVAPYIGIGTGRPAVGASKWGFSFDLGVIFQGSPKVDLSVSGPLASDPDLQRELAKEEKDIEDEMEGFKYYPVLSLGVIYRF